MSENPLKIFEKLDPELFKLVERNNELAFTDGVLSKKHKLLIALALDASRGAVQGVKALARESKQAGATIEEVTEALRVAQYICGVGSVYTAAAALRELF